MREVTGPINHAEPVTRQETRQAPATRHRPAADPPPDPPATHPHKGRLLDVIA
jgi:hypothetical protein